MTIHIRRLLAFWLVVGLAAGCAVVERIVPAPAPTTDEDPGAFAWAASAKGHRGADRKTFEYVCPELGHVHPIWGTDVYTDDSSVCTAAVHAGLIGLDGGGRVRIVIRPGLEAYVGTSRNGMISEDYGPWAGSFSFVGS